MEYTQKELVERFESFFEKEEYASQIADIVAGIEGKRSVIVQYNDLANFDPAIAEALITDPEYIIGSAESALKEYIERNFEPLDRKSHVRIAGLSELSSIRNLRSEDVGKFIAIEALVKKATEVRPKLMEAAFKCMHPSCGKISFYEQEGPKLTEPIYCKACEKTRSETKFKLIPAKSKFIDEERLEVQEMPEKLKGGQQPQRLVAIGEDDITGQVAPGDRVIITGILKALPRSYGNIRLTTFDFRLEISYIEKQNKEYGEIKPSEEEIAEIEKVAKGPNPIDAVTASIAPTISGMDEEKRALALQLFGGVPKEMPDGTRIRGDIHILLVGDPGTAKSQLLRYMSALSPRGQYASGKSASAAGLTAAAVKDDTGDGRWTLEAGALVLADGGIACIDEMDKMSKEDRSSMHEAMEQQTITIVKAGISATMKSRCAVLGAANPKFGRFSGDSESLIEEIDLPAPLISRFDIIFTIKDRPESKRDEEIADHILKGHKIGEELRKGVEPTMDMVSHQPLLSPEFLKKYVSYAKETNPVLTDGAIKKIKKYYLNTRKKGGEAQISITARHLEALVRMAEASAKIRLSEHVTEDDAQIAIDIMEGYLSKVLSYDVDLAYTKESRKKRTARQIITHIVEELIKEEGSADFSTIIQRAEAEGLTKMEAEDILEKMKREGTIYEEFHGRYKTV